MNADSRSGFAGGLRLSGYADADSARKGSVNLGELKFLDPMPPLHNEPPAKPETKK